jgi:hypothetical protein
MIDRFMNGELERMWKEAVVTYLKLLSKHYHTEIMTSCTKGGGVGSRINKVPNSPFPLTDLS